MNFRLIALACAALCASGCAATAHDAHADRAAHRAACERGVTDGPAVEQIRVLEQRGAAVNVEGWTIEEARGFFAPEWVSVQPDGSITRLDTVMAGFPNGRSQPWAQSFALTELDIRVYCHTAVVVGMAEVHPRGAPESVVLRMRFTNVWRQEGDRWLYAANQYVRL